MQIDAAEVATHRRPESEAQAEHRAHEAEAARAVLRRGDVGNIGIGHRRIRLHGPAEQAHHNQHPHRGGKPGDDEAQRQAREAEQEDGPPPEFIGQGAEDGRRDEIGHTERQRHRAEPEGLFGRRAGEGADEHRQHRHDEADRDHVDKDGQHDEGHRGCAAARRHRRCRHGRGMAADSFWEVSVTRTPEKFKSTSRAWRARPKPADARAHRAANAPPRFANAKNRPRTRRAKLLRSLSRHPPWRA